MKIVRGTEVHLIFLSILVFLGGCARTTTPVHTTNICSILQQKDGFFSGWHLSAKKAERLYGISMPILLATIYVESEFYQRARPPRKKLFGFIPGLPVSTAYGYAQALDGTWNDYREKTGNSGANRTTFHDSADFIAWYHRESVRKNRISPNDAYNLYLSYYMGHRAYAAGRVPNLTAIKTARKMQAIAHQYNEQLRECSLR